MTLIHSINLYRLELPLRVPYKLAFGPVTHFDTLIVEAQDSEGKIGLGEATILTGYTDETIDGSWILLQELAKKSIKHDLIGNQQLLQHHIHSSPFTVTALATALEMVQKPAIYDVPAQSPIPILGVVNSENPNDLDIELNALLLAGFRTLKVKVGFEVDKDSNKVKTIQRILGNRAEIRIDGNQGYSREQAIKFIRQLDPNGIELFEQPCHADDWDSALAIAQMAHVPMMLDESIYGLEDIHKAASLKAATFIKVKLMKLGSLEKLLDALSLISELGMKPVLGNGVAGEIGCWMEAVAARTHIKPKIDFDLLAQFITSKNQFH